MARKVDTTARDVLQEALLHLPDEKLATLARQAPDSILATAVRGDIILQANCFARVLQAAIQTIGMEDIGEVRTMLRKGSRTRSKKAASGASLDERVLDAIGGIAGTDGVSSTQIAELVEAHKTQVVKSLNVLLAARKIKKTGKNKSTRYHLREA